MRLLLRNDQWEPIKDLLPSRQGDPGVTARDNRLFVEAVLWIEHTGAPWRDLPREFGKWHTVYMRFHRLTKKGVWKQIVERLCGEADLEKFIPDSTARGRERKIDDPQAIGRSCEGLTTRFHAATDISKPRRCLRASVPRG